VNLVVVCIISPKTKEPSKLFKGDFIPPSLDHLMKFSCVPPLLNIQGGQQLIDDLIIPILLESHAIPQMLGSTSTHYLIKEHVMLSLHVSPIYPLEHCHGLGLCNDD
jgi:hypothetical protein